MPENLVSPAPVRSKSVAAGSVAPGGLTAFGQPRDSLGKRFIYAVLSPRAHGLVLGVNFNPDKRCNFACEYCEVDRSRPAAERALDVAAMARELEEGLDFIHAGRMRERAWCRTMPEELLKLRHVSLSGDGEPTLAPNFAEAVRAIVHVRAKGRWPFFKMVLLTNATGLHLPETRAGLDCFTRADEVWAKLEAGSEEYFRTVNRPDGSLETVSQRILELARQRPVVIQSLFPSLDGNGPGAIEIERYAARLLALKEGGAHISLVQIYSATRQPLNPACGHLPLKALSDIARRVRAQTGLRVEVY